MHRYFSGHTKNPDGSVQFIAEKTSFGDAINGVVKIATIAVRSSIRIRLQVHACTCIVPQLSWDLNSISEMIVTP